MSRFLRLVVLLASMFAASLAWGDVPGNSWDQLTKEEQKSLQPFKEQWPSLSPEKQQKLRRGAEKWGRMTPDERREAQERYKRWQKMSPEQQGEDPQEIFRVSKAPS